MKCLEFTGTGVLVVEGNSVPVESVMSVVHALEDMCRKLNGMGGNVHLREYSTPHLAGGVFTWVVKPKA